MKTKLTLIAAALLTTVLTSCGNGDKKTNEQVKTESSDSTKYTCPMHPEVISDKPGKCSKCGMDLVKK